MNISKHELLEFLQVYADHSIYNSVPEAIALSPKCAGLRMYEWPLVGISSCLLYTSPSPRDGLLSRMPSSA